MESDVVSKLGPTSGLLERFNDPADKRQRLVSVLAALYFVKIGHDYGMLALPGILPRGAQPAPATQDPAADGNGLHVPLVILPWFRSELTVVPVVPAAAVAAPASASITSRKRKRAVQVDGVIKMIEAQDDPEPVPQGEHCDYCVSLSPLFSSFC